MTVDLAHFRSRPEDCILDEDGLAPLDADGDWEYTAVPVLDRSQHLTDGVTPICAQTNYRDGLIALPELGLEMLTPDDVELLHILSTRGLCIELPAFTNTATAETSLFHRIKSDEGNRANAKRLGWRPGMRLCNWGKGSVAGAPPGRMWIMGWHVPNLAAYSPPPPPGQKGHRSGPGYVQPRPAPGSQGAHDWISQADDGTNLWGKRRRNGGVGRRIHSFGAAIVAGASEIASMLGGHPLSPPAPQSQGGHPLPPAPPAKDTNVRSTIQLGSKGTLVSIWQATVGVAVDGDFGPGTEAATKQWQAARGLVADGRVGPASWARADEDATKATAPKPSEPAKTPTILTLQDVKLVRAKNFRTANRPASAVLWIVLHSMESAEKPYTAENVAAWFASSSAPMASAHFCIDSDSIVQCVPLKDVAFAAPGANAEGVHIEMAGYARQTEAEWLDDFGLAMLSRVALVMAHLSELYDIPLEYVDVDGLNARRKGVTTHFDVSKAFKKSDHQDPGKGFPMAKVLSMAMAARATLPG
jgi:peptidoglycan hydrolase-like protein with peptidoglycan-binding domain